MLFLDLNDSVIDGQTNFRCIHPIGMSPLSHKDKRAHPHPCILEISARLQQTEFCDSHSLLALH